MSNNKAYDELVTRARIGGTIENIVDQLSWDRDTGMPIGDADQRAEQIEYMTRQQHRHATDPRIGELLAKVDTSALTEAEQANVREMKRDYTKVCRVPEELAAKIANVASKATVVWEHAKETNDFNAFLPHLETLIRLTKERSSAIDARKHPYEVCLDDFEPGMTVDNYTELFAEYRVAIPALIQRLPLKPLSAKQKKLLACEVKGYKQRAYLENLLRYIGYDFSRGMLAQSAHPFSSNTGRVAYGKNENWLLSIFSTGHEGGHGRYQHKLPVEHLGEPLGMPQSYSVHESQSRLWENHVCKSREFWENQYAVLAAAYKPLLRWTKQSEFYKLINHVEPGYIRVDADELTYGLHVLLRFELEFDLFNGSLQAKDLPSAWNEKMREYLGIVPPDDTRGCLQDVHWSEAFFGYFPTYLYGSMLASQLWDALGRGVPNRDSLVAHGKFRDIDEWLNEYIYSVGRQYSTHDLIVRATGSPPSSESYIRYLTDKYTELYKS